MNTSLSPSTKSKLAKVIIAVVVSVSVYTIYELLVEPRSDMTGVSASSITPVVKLAPTISATITDPEIPAMLVALEKRKVEQENLSKSYQRMEIE